MEKQKESILNKSINRAFYGGISGFTAMGVQVTSLMWLRTTMNYQYRYGGTIKNTVKTLYKDGGLLRFYRGYFAAMSIGPLSRFGDTAANTFAMSINNENTPLFIKTVSGSVLASGWRLFLMPIDAIKTNLQVNGNLDKLKNKISNNGTKVIYNGSLASMSATFVGHYPWFLTYNILSEKIPEQKDFSLTLLRNGFIGFTSSVVSDCFSNSLRVIKTVRQTHQNQTSYVNIVNDILKNDGIKSLLGRGLQTRILTNGIQGMMFTICWKYFEKKFIN